MAQHRDLTHFTSSAAKCSIKMSRLLHTALRQTEPPLAAREQRVNPSGTKVLTSWNGLMVSGMIHAGPCSATRKRCRRHVRR